MKGHCGAGHLHQKQRASFDLAKPEPPGGRQGSGMGGVRVQGDPRNPGEGQGPFFPMFRGGGRR